MPETLTLDLPQEAPLPEEALDRLCGLPGRVLLRSAGGKGHYSFLAAAPLETLNVRKGENAFQQLDALLERWGGGHAVSVGHEREGPPFAGGIVGYFSYEAADVLERLPPPPEDDLGIPLGWFGVYECGVLWETQTGQCRVVGSVLPGRSREELRWRMEELVGRILGKVGSMMGDADTSELDVVVNDGDSTGGAPSSSLSRTEFMAGVERIRRYIRAGDLFQANLTRRISIPTTLSGPDLFRNLLQASAAPYAAYLDCGEVEIASISPELFLSLRGREVRTSPIKGTTRRGKSAEEDQALRETLAQSEKNRSENIMIVDLLRNDLSKVALPGTITVPLLAEVEEHPTVHHLVSTITGTLDPGVGVGELLRATFPGGSVTGAPKIRAMEVLRELEPVQRGIYTGALGIISFDGDADLSITIRTVTLQDGVAHYGTGGGITLASDPEEEWAETEEKAKAFFQALGVE